MSVIAKPNYTHAAMIDLIIQSPGITQRQIAAHFGYTEGWVSQVINSDCVREMLAARRDELIDPTILQSLERKMEALAHQSLEILAEDLQARRSADTALKALEVTSRGLGYGAKAGGTNVNLQFVVAMPQKEASGDSWVTAHKPRVPIGVTLDSVIEVPMTQ